MTTDTIMENKDRELGLCPVCGHGHIIKTNRDYVCTDRLRPSGSHSCRFSMPLRTHGVDVTDGMIRQLIQHGETELMEMCNQDGFPYQGRFVVGLNDYVVKPELRTLDAVCPDCGGQIVKTRSGYACINKLSHNPTCDFIVPNYICDRFITEAEATAFLHGEPDVLDGFVNKTTNSIFSAYLTRGKDGKVVLSSRIGTCPHCGGRMLVGVRAFNCSNYKKDGCEFKVWKHYYGHKTTLREVRDLLEHGEMTTPFEGYSPNGHIQRSVLRTGSKFEIQVIPYKENKK